MTQASPLESIFFAALGKPSPAERSAFLDEVCAGDEALRREVERILAAQQQAGSFLEQPLCAVSTTEMSGPSLIGAQIGPYKLREQIGEGGMGVVYVAEQTEPVKRKVALKLIKPGMDSRQVVARFEAERQVLAMMDHPNIAHVFDGGSASAASSLRELWPAADSPTDDSHGTRSVPATLGQPYFVMELVQGPPITEYCDQLGLSTRQRLQLFLQVCQAVQHAHQKGIIHRDLKPSNVLVPEIDGTAVPKVIDFGVAKAVNQELTEQTLYTQFSQMVGTPLYMSPEQAGLGVIDVDTRSDIYSLGVLLYELLTGSTPFDGETLKRAGFDEMRRIIREVEPPKPSVMVSTLNAQALSTVAQRRGSDPRKLSASLAGELDWIVMKALEKDRGRRYETASKLAEDVKHYMKDEAVEARPPTFTYRFRKFARRNQAALATAILVTLAALVAVGSVGWAFRDQAARQAKASEQLELILGDAAKLERAEKWHDALIAARRAEPMLVANEAAPEIQQRVRQVLADLQFVQRLDEIRAEAGIVWEARTSENAAPDPIAVQAEHEYAHAFREAGIDVDSLSVDEVARRIADRRSIAAAMLPAIDDWIAVRSKLNDEAATRRLVEILRAADPDPWRQQVRNGVASRDWTALANLVESTDLAQQPAATLGFLAAALYPDRYQLAIDMLRQAQWNNPADYWINHRLGVQLIWTRSPDQVQEGIGFLRAAVALRPYDSYSVMNLGNGYYFLGRRDQAIACFRKALELSPDYSACYGNLGEVLRDKGLYDEAIAALEQALKLNPGSAAVRNAELSIIHSNRPEEHLRNVDRALELAREATEVESNFSNNWTALGIARYRRGEYREACEALARSLQSYNWGPGGATGWDDAINSFFLAMSHRQLGQIEQARQWYEIATTAVDGKRPRSELLIRIRQEAKSLLEIVRADGAASSTDVEPDDSPWELPDDAPPPAIAPFDAEQASELQAAWARYLETPVEYQNTLGMRFRLIPPGEFMMGSSAEDIEDLLQIAKNTGWPDWEANELNFEGPQRIVRVEHPFYIAACETTIANFRVFVEATGYVTTGERTGDGGWAAHQGQWVRQPEHVWKSPGPWKLLEDQPVVQLSHHDAKAFCKWLSKQEGLTYSLPRETQWEFAARAGTTRRYGPSDSPDTLLEWSWNSLNLPVERPGQPQPVGLKAANRWGLHDMLGNVWEMCSDLHAGLRAGWRVGRGGSFINQVIRSRPASRGASDPERAWDCATGFRVVIVGDLNGVRQQAEKVAGKRSANSPRPEKDRNDAGSGFGDKGGIDEQ